MKHLQLLLMRSVLVTVLIFVSGIALADSIRLATTTSTYNSGLLDYLLNYYAQASDTEVQVISVGTGKALRMGENGDVDLLMTHAPAAEARLLDPYQVILVNPVRHQHANVKSAREFAQWMVSSEGQGIIGKFRINGEVLFVPSAL